MVSRNSQGFSRLLNRHSSWIAPTTTSTRPFSSTKSGPQAQLGV